MPMNKIDQTFEIEQEQLDWLGEIATSYGLSDEAKALRVLLGLRHRGRRQRPHLLG